MANKNDRFYVYSRTTGGAYICERAVRTSSGKYFWIKDKNSATPLTKSQARSVARRYGGTVRSF